MACIDPNKVSEYGLFSRTASKSLKIFSVIRQRKSGVDPTWGIKWAFDSRLSSHL